MRVPEGTQVGHGDTFSIEVDGFNVAFYSSSPVAAGQPNAAYVEMAVDSSGDKGFLTRVFHDSVPPGHEASDPAKQPVSVNDYLYTVPADATGVEIRIEPDFAVSYKLD